MVSAGRVACVTVPMLLTLGSVITMAILFASNSSPNGSLRDIYYFHADTRNFSTAITAGALADTIQTAETLTNTSLDQSVITAIDTAKKALNVADGYSIGLWNYCSGPYTNNTFTPNFCSPKSRNFYFNPIEIWKLDNSTVSDVLPNSLIKALKVYKTASYWNIIAHIVALSLSAGSFVLGFTSICSKVMSSIVSLIMFISTIFFLLSALATTIIYAAIKTAFQTALKPYGIYASMGPRGLALEWLGFAFALSAWLFWTISICCCSTHSYSPSYKNKGQAHTAAPIGAYTYRAVDSEKPSYDNHPQHAPPPVSESAYSNGNVNYAPPTTDTSYGNGNNHHPHTNHTEGLSGNNPNYYNV